MPLTTSHQRHIKTRQPSLSQRHRQTQATYLRRRSFKRWHNRPADGLRRFGGERWLGRKLGASSLEGVEAIAEKVRGGVSSRVFCDGSEDSEGGRVGICESIKHMLLVPATAPNWISQPPPPI
ncbi:hypothetical protein BC936DRAFT_149871, partial [Jimgerdemannia flammicorona]